MVRMDVRVWTGVPVYRLRGAGFAPAPRAFDWPLCPPAAAPVCAPPRPPLCPAPGNASKGGLHSVPPPRARGGFSLAPSPRARSRIPLPCAGRFWRAATGAGGENGSAPVRGAFFHRLRSGSPHGSAPFPCGTLGVGGELQKAAPSAPPPCGTTFSFPRGTGPPAARRRRSPVRRIFTPVPHSFSRAPAFSRRARIPVLFLDNPRARRL